MNRRQFLGVAAGFAIANGQEHRIIDTHTHFYDPARPQGVPWPPKTETMLYRSVLPLEYEGFARPLGVTGTIVVEASPWLEDNQWVLDVAQRDPFVVGLVGHLEPGKSEFKAHLERFRRNPLFLGIRVGDEAVSNALTSVAYASDFQLLAETGLEVDALGSLSTELVRFADRFWRLRMVIEHLPGEPPADPVKREAARRTLGELGQRGHVFGKVSGVLRRVNGHVPLDVEFYRPALDELWESFGPDRLIYGSNWPVCELVAPYAEVQKVVMEYFDGKGRDAAERFFWKNSRRAYRWTDIAR
jgi:L-fuconolactonase